MTDVSRPASYSARKVRTAAGSDFRSFRRACSPSVVNEPTNSGKRRRVAIDDAIPNWEVTSAS